MPRDFDGPVLDTRPWGFHLKRNKYGKELIKVATWTVIEHDKRRVFEVEADKLQVLDEDYRFVDERGSAVFVAPREQIRMLWRQGTTERQ